MASFWTRLADTLTPWDRDGERKRREERAQQQAPRIVRPTPQPNIQVQRNQTIGGQEFNLGVQPNREVSLPRQAQTVQRRDYDKPKQSLWNKIVDQFDANTEADQYRRQQQLLDAAEERGVDRDVARRALDEDPERKRELLRRNNLIPSVANFARDTAVGIGRGARYVATNPVESARASVAQATDNREAQRASATRQRQNANRLVGRDVDDMSRMSGWEAIEGLGNVVSVLPAAQGARMVAQGAREAVATNALRPLITRGIAGADEALLGIRGFLQSPQAARDAGEIAESAQELAALNVLSPGQLDDLARRTDIPVRSPINITAPVDEGVRIPTRNTTPQGPIIREVGGDSPRVTSVPTREEIQQARFRNQEFGGADQRVEGVTGPISRQEYTTKAEIDVERQALDDALANEEINKTQHRKANKDLDDMEKSLDGRKIEVQESETIPVREETDIPVDEEVGAGTVRKTTVTDRTGERTQAAANQQAQASVVPPEVQQVLDNPKSYSKTQVASARNQAKLARQYAKAQEAVAEANERVQAASSQARVGQSDRFAPTGVLAEGKKGNVYEKASREAEIDLGRKEMSTRSAEDLVDELDGRSGINEGSQRKIEAAIENLKQADPEGKASADLQRVLTERLTSDRTKIAQMLAIGRRVLRRTATSDALTNRWSAKMSRVGDLKNVSDADLQAVQRANDNFTAVRDRARAAEEAFKNDPSDANLRAVKKALTDEQKASIDAVDTELAVSKRVLKGEKGPKAEKVISDLEAEAELHMMDSVTASQLSGPATGARNLFGTYAAGVENRIGANTRARISNRLFGQNVGGFDRASARAGRREGWDKYVSDIGRRSSYSGKNPLKQARNFATSLNQAGESSMHSQIQSRLGAYYKNQLRSQGVKGDELTRRTEFMRLTDPDNMQREFLDQTMKASGLSGIITKGKRVEQGVADMISGGLEQTGLVSPKWSKKTARALTRLAVGYPTATGNFLVQSSKRATLGLPSFVESGVMLKRGDPTAAARAFDRALKEAGSGAAMLGTGFVLGSAGLVSGSYPDDPDERARWEREGISENSIRIGNTWRPIPQSLGMLGLPIMLGAAVGRDGGEGVQEMFTPKNLTKLLPHDQVQGFMNLASGGGTEAQEKNFVASTIRSGMPLGSLFNQVSKGLDPTRNDTTTRSFWRNVFDQVVTGIPGQHKFADIPDKRSDTGEAITNPGFADVMTGATTAVQAGGEQRSREINQNINSQVQSIADTGIFGNEGMREILDDDTKLVWDKALRGEQLDPSDMKALNSGLTKGVTTGKGPDSDTAYRERGDYDMDLAVLTLKKQLLEADPTTKPSNLKDLDVQISRSKVLKDNDIPYGDLQLYQSVGVEDWRKMGDPEDDLYDPDTYQKLWDIDKMFAQAGGSYGKDAGSQKYSAKKKGSGSGSGGGRSMTAKFYGGLGTPERRAYAQTALSRGGPDIPVIRRVRPNIVHRIGRG